jgi:hypothetical protein
MKILSLLILSLVGPALLRADEAASRLAAGEILELTNASGAMKSGFSAMVEPMITTMQQRGMPVEAAAEMRAAMAEWFDKEIKWEDLKPKMVELYAKEFTEKELQDLLAFYRTPSGRKALAKLPVIMQEGAKIGQEYAVTKQESLGLKMKEVANKYRPK